MPIGEGEGGNSLSPHEKDRWLGSALYINALKPLIPSYIGQPLVGCVARRGTCSKMYCHSDPPSCTPRLATWCMPVHSVVTPHHRHHPTRQRTSRPTNSSSLSGHYSCLSEDKCLTRPNKPMAISIQWSQLREGLKLAILSTQPRPPRWSCTHPATCGRYRIWVLALHESINQCIVVLEEP